MRLSHVLLASWATLSVGVVTWALFAPGEFALRDMVVLDHPYLTHASVGFGDVPGRNVPQDAVLAILGNVVPATWVVRVLLVGAAVAAAWAAIVGARWPKRLGMGKIAAAAAVTVAVVNPFVVERLLQGQWSLVLAAWLAPAIAIAGLRKRTGVQILALWVSSLTPTGALAASLTAFATNRSRSILLASALAWAPWAVTGALHPGSGRSLPAGAHAFAPRAEEGVGTLGAMVGLGGIWNGAAVPESRTAGFAIFGVALFAVLLLAARKIPRSFMALACVGFGIALTSWLAPEVMGWLVAHVPGAGLLRDGHKWLILAIPAYVAAAGALRPTLAWAALALAVLQVPDAPVSLAQLRPVEVAVPAVDHQGRDVYFVDRPALITRADGVPVVDPAAKAMNVVEPGGLQVDDLVVDTNSLRFEEGIDDPAAHEIGLVVYPGGQVVDTGVPARPLPPLGLGLLILWGLTPLVAVLPAAMRGRSSSAQSAGRNASR